MLRKNYISSALLVFSLAFYAQPASAVLRVITSTREEFYVFQSSVSGSVRELTFSATAPGASTRGSYVVGMEGKAFHENLILNYALATRKQSYEYNVRAAWSSFKSNTSSYQSYVNSYRTQYSAAVNRIARVEALLQEPSLTAEQKAQLQNEIASDKSTLQGFEANINRYEKTIKDYRASALNAENAAIKDWESLYNSFKQELDKAFDSRTHIIIVPLAQNSNLLGYWLEQIAKSGCQYRSTSGSAFQHQGLAPSPKNDWNAVPNISPNLTIDRQGAV